METVILGSAWRYAAHSYVYAAYYTTTHALVEFIQYNFCSELPCDVLITTKYNEPRRNLVSVSLRSLVLAEQSCRFTLIQSSYKTPQVQLWRPTEPVLAPAVQHFNCPSISRNCLAQHFAVSTNSRQPHLPSFDACSHLWRVHSSSSCCIRHVH